MKFVAVLPSIWPDWTNLCMATMADELVDHLHIVDNTRRNLGVAASWNVGVRAMRDEDADWLVIVSAGVRFGAPGGRDFLRHLEAAPGGAETPWAVEGGECANDPTIGLGWHLIAFSASTFDRVGLFDENFWPGYYEDLDFGHRIRVATPQWSPGPDPIWPKVNIDADLAGFAHGKRLAGVEVPVEPLRQYFARKWGGLVGDDWYDRPFGDPKLGLDYWPEPDRRP